MFIAMLYDNDASQTAANKKSENKHDNNTLAAEDEDLLDNIDLSSKSVL